YNRFFILVYLILLLISISGLRPVCTEAPHLNNYFWHRLVHFEIPANRSELQAPSDNCFEYCQQLSAPDLRFPAYFRWLLDCFLSEIWHSDIPDRAIIRF